jgi:hypothetical protein
VLLTRLITRLRARVLARPADLRVSDRKEVRAMPLIQVKLIEGVHWAIGGQPLSTEDVKALAAGVPVG